MVESSQYIPSHASSGSQLLDGMTRMVIDESNASSSSAAGAAVSGTQPNTRSRSSSFRNHTASITLQLTKMMAIIPGVGELLDGVSNEVHNYKDGGSNRQALVSLEELLKSILSSTDPRRLNSNEGHAEFVKCIRRLHVSVQNQLGIGLGRRLEFARRLDDFKTELAGLLDNAIKAGYLVQRGIYVPEEFDKVIPSLKMVNEANGLVIREQISIQGYGGGPAHESFDHLVVCTYQAMYNDVPVEVEDYYGGRECLMIQTVKELVGDYNRRAHNPILQKLHGGSVYRDQNQRLHAYLVLAPREGTPWVQLVNAKRSVELLCQIAEKTSIVFKQLRQDGQMNFNDIHVRSDGTLQLIPHTKGERFLLDEDVFSPSAIGQDGQDKVGWPFKDLCHLLHESSKQGLVRGAVAALRAHEGTWDQIAVWRVAREVGVRPSPGRRTFDGYPPDLWSIDPGWIIHWPEPNAMQEKPNFKPVVRLPKEMMEDWELENMGSFLVTHARGHRGGGDYVSYFDRNRGENWFLPTEWADWECIPLEPWQGVTSITLYYESVRLDMVGWDDWKHALKIAAKKKGLNEEDLGVVSLAYVTINIFKEDIPELGTRPIYFYRRRSGLDTSPRQFWGFFTFNRNPLGPPGITLRHSEPYQYCCVVSDSLPPYPPGYEQKFPSRLSIDVEYVNMRDDWDVLIKRKREHERRHRIEPVYAEETLEWEWDMDVDQA